MDQWTLCDGTKAQAEDWGHSEDIALLVEEESGLSCGDDRRCVKHIFREHTQEAHHLTNLGAEGQRKITVDKGDNAELEGGTRILGRHQKDRRKERMGSCDLRCGQRQVDHKKCNYSTSDDLHGHGI